MTLSAQDLAFLERNHSAAMITAAPTGVARAVRVGVALVEGRLIYEFEVHRSYGLH